jgi:hypothetical protein
VCDDYGQRIRVVRAAMGVCGSRSFKTKSTSTISISTRFTATKQLFEAHTQQSHFARMMEAGGEALAEPPQTTRCITLFPRYRLQWRRL